MPLHSDELYAAVLRATLIRRILRDRPFFTITLSTQSAAVDAVFNQPTHNGIGAVARRFEIGISRTHIVGESLDSNDRREPSWGPQGSESRRQ
jgi:hypothetical protein